MKDEAARLFGVERVLLDSGTKRRSVVQARRTVMAAASRGGLPGKEIAAAFGLRSPRAVLEACRWVEREQARDRRYAAMFHEVARVLLKA
jgi:chromosomal replication initiation ATPase DnaA